MKKIDLQHEVPDYEKLTSSGGESSDVPKKKGYPTMYLSHESIPASAKPGDRVTLHGQVKEVTHRKTRKAGEDPETHSSMDIEVHHMEHTATRGEPGEPQEPDDAAIDRGLNEASERASKK